MAQLARAMFATTFSRGVAFGPPWLSAFVMLANRMALFGGALSLLASLRAMLDDLSPHHPLLKVGTASTGPTPTTPRRAASSPTSRLPAVPPAPPEPAALLDAADANPAAAGPRRRWNAHQALWEIHMVRGNAWLAERFDIGRHGRLAATRRRRTSSSSRRCTLYSCWSRR